MVRGENVTARLGIVSIIKLGTLFALCIIILLPLFASVHATDSNPPIKLFLHPYQYYIDVPNTGTYSSSITLDISNINAKSVSIIGYALNGLPSGVSVTFPPNQNILPLGEITNDWPITIAASAQPGTYTLQVGVLWQSYINGVLQTGWVYTTAILNLEKSVGGIVVPVGKFGLLAPYISFASTILVATVATGIYVKHVKRRKEKQ